VFLAAGIQHRHLKRYQPGRQRHVLRHYQVTGQGMGCDVLVCYVSSAINPYRTHERIAGGCLESLVRNQDGLDVQPLG
jgi:hypothetical protein